MSEQFLYQKLDSVKEYISLPQIPDYITSNLSSHIKLREYQKNAIKNTILYLENPKASKNKQTHLLYHMATGSGKTIIMAMDILYYYNLGYRNFLFFTNQTSIVNKTKINFTDINSRKYLFSKFILMNGKKINIRIVDNFQSNYGEDICIAFNTVQGIHSELLTSKENALTYEDFENTKVVLLADEAHHLNSLTSKSDKDDIANEKTWEYTINRIFMANKDNVLLEFTATCNLKDQNVLSKYLDKIIFNYTLREFRENGFTKEFSNFSSNVTPWQRTLQALILSEFRKLYFNKYGIYSKPIVMLKSYRIADSKKFYIEFYEKLKAFNPDEINAIKMQNDNEFKSRYLTNAFNFFEENKISNESLADMIKIDFAEENALQMNGDSTTTEDIYTKANTLDDKNNNYRLIFTVSKLNEGWDVLGLYDIVRLFDTRQGGKHGQPSDFTIAEAQLIGRGARYFPFKFNEEQSLDKKKYTNDIENPEAICETLIYHCVNEARYITELKLALQKTGFEPEKKIEVKYSLKDSFKKTKTYQEGVVFVNERVEKSRLSITSIPQKLRDEIIPFYCGGGKSREGILFNENNVEGINYNRITKKIKELPINVVYKAFRSYYSSLSFEILLEKFPNLKSQKEFLLDDNYLGNITICFLSQNNTLNYIDIYNACLKVMNKISSFVQKIEITFEGTRQFTPKRISELLHKPIVRQISYDRMNSDNFGEGISQNDLKVPEIFRLDISQKDWYVYNDNKGTSEEKKFVTYFDSMIDSLNKKYQEIYLIRNELVIKLYSFENGERFEPDYFLILKQKKDNAKNDYLCVFIEPKGEHLLSNDKWKNDFLLELESKAIPVKIYVDDNDYRIWGMPFYNESSTKNEFDKYFKEKLL
ncbi:MAG: DEAD/DEAH box helicase family protein [Erysipelotrichales bacterium]|nr:DEAD/DEAH box helicase family protein [Erysipelotrichales bacterium]